MSKHMIQTNSGMTLLELLIVVAILAATAMVALTTMDGEQDQVHFIDTQQRIDKIRTSIAGRGLKDKMGALIVDGFVADMGRLPESLKELTTKIMDCDADGTDEADGDGDGVADDCEWQYDTASTLWHGWQGPYLIVNADSNNELAFRDGWRNRGSAPNYGWSITLNDTNADSIDDEFIIQSLAKDGLVNPAAVVDYNNLNHYERDYPATKSPTVDPTKPPEAIISSNDHEINIKGLKFVFHLINPCTPDLVIPTTCTGPALTTNTNSTASNLRIKLFYPVDGQIIDSWPAAPVDRDAADNLSELIDISTHSVADNTVQIVTYNYSSNDTYIPWGARSFILVNEVDGSQYIDPMINVAFPYGLDLISGSTLPEIHFYWRLE